VINVYEEVHRADGHTLWLHMNDGRQETFAIAAGNLHSDVVPVHLGDGTASLSLSVAHVIPASPPPADTEWVKHVTVRSEKLTRFWGRPISIHATVLLPDGYADHPDVRYPCIYTLGHDVPFSFTTDASVARGREGIHPATGLENGYDFQRAWTAKGFPRVIAISLQQQTPFFPDSYSVNSANTGPYGDAFVEELVPQLEHSFRIIAEPGRAMSRALPPAAGRRSRCSSTHPDLFGGAWVLQPDPIDFRRYQLVDIYQDANAFEVPSGQFGVAERPFRVPWRGSRSGACVS
jgi:hypothetical protein